MIVDAAAAADDVISTGGDLPHVSVTRLRMADITITITVTRSLTSPGPPEVVTRAWASPTSLGCPAPTHLWSHLA